LGDDAAIDRALLLEHSAVARGDELPIDESAALGRSGVARRSHSLRLRAARLLMGGAWT